MANESSPERLAPVEEVKLLRSASCDWRLCRGDVAVYAVLLMHCDGDGHAFPGPSRISELARLAVTNVKAALKHLEDLEYIEVIRPGLRKANRYIVKDSPKVPLRKTAKILVESRRSLGMPASPRLGTKSYPDWDAKKGGN